MTKVIVSTHYNRPYYTSRCIHAMENAIDIDQYIVLFHIDPGNQQVIDIVEQSDLNKEIFINSTRRGFGYNMVHSFTHGFAISDYVILIEDDIIISCDALLYFDYARRFCEDQRVFSVTAYNRLEHPPSSQDYFKIKRRNWYHGWGSATWIDRWQRLLDHGCKWNTMDVSILDTFLNDQVEIYPILSRCQNIGVLQGMNQFNVVDQNVYKDTIHLIYWYNNILSNGTIGEFHE